MSKPFLVIEDVVEYDSEDSDQALIADCVGDDDDTGMFVRIQSWDDECKHEQAKQLAGKRVRITIEILPE